MEPIGKNGVNSNGQQKGRLSSVKPKKKYGEIINGHKVGQTSGEGPNESILDSLKGGSRPVIGSYFHK